MCVPKCVYLNVTSQPGSTTSRARSTTVAQCCSLWAYHSLTVLFLGTHEQLPSGSHILEVLWHHSCLTSEFLRNPKPDHSPGQCGMSQSTPLRGPTSLSAHFRPWIGSNTSRLTSELLRNPKPMSS
ncbi:hypothetical protein DVH24_038527 [Malus domestica]|uniref:Uncharacterized protein n=1 Tax=Malus domestica TaxID=3750 RepID=A0A498KFK7_MALDO|nr:hypothetical protein DVH24_038527 [Malus domestica]